MGKQKCDGAKELNSFGAAKEDSDTQLTNQKAGTGSDTFFWGKSGTVTTRFSVSIIAARSAWISGSVDRWLGGSVIAGSMFDDQHGAITGWEAGMLGL